MDTPAWYRITVQEQLGETLQGLLSELRIECKAGGQSALTGFMADQAALNGTLNTLHALGLTVLQLERLELPPTEKLPGWEA